MLADARYAGNSHSSYRPTTGRLIHSSPGGWYQHEHNPAICRPSNQDQHTDHGYIRLLRRRRRRVGKTQAWCVFTLFAFTLVLFAFLCTYLCLSQGTSALFFRMCCCGSTSSHLDANKFKSFPYISSSQVRHFHMCGLMPTQQQQQLGPSQIQTLVAVLWIRMQIVRISSERRARNANAKGQSALNEHPRNSSGAGLSSSAGEEVESRWEFVWRNCSGSCICDDSHVNLHCYSKAFFNTLSSLVPAAGSEQEHLILLRRAPNQIVADFAEQFPFTFIFAFLQEFNVAHSPSVGAGERPTDPAAFPIAQYQIMRRALLLFCHFFTAQTLLARHRFWLGLQVLKCILTPRISTSKDLSVPTFKIDAFEGFIHEWNSFIIGTASAYQATSPW